MGCGVGLVFVLLIIYTFILFSYTKEKVFVKIALMNDERYGVDITFLILKCLKIQKWFKKKCINYVS